MLPLKNRKPTKTDAALLHYAKASTGLYKSQFELIGVLNRFPVQWPSFPPKSRLALFKDKKNLANFYACLFFCPDKGFDVFRPLELCLLEVCPAEVCLEEVCLEYSWDVP